mgnify:CR=1 FL=1
MSSRKTIRAKIAAILTTPTLTGIVNVFESRQARLAPEELPAVIVYTKSEAAEISNVAPREYKRTLKVAVDIARLDTSATPGDDFLDDVAELIEQRLFQNETLDGLASDTFLSDTEIDFITDAQGEIALCRMTFDVIYYTQAPIEQPNLDAFERYSSEIKLPSATPTTPKDLDETELPQI